jgi:ribose/xylose/arabinose/galactoside ABC-type transport system permease subunit
VSIAPHRLAIATMFVLLAGGVALSVAPFEAGTIRLAGVSLLWWYGVIVAPVLAVAVTVAAVAHGARRSAPSAAPGAE